MQNVIVNTKKKGMSQANADFLIALIAITWGSSYLMMKVGLESIPPFSLMALRFGIAFICIAIVFAKKLKSTTLRILKKSAIIGGLLFGIFSFLLHGMETTTASNAGFLISTAVVLVPVINSILRHRLPEKKIIIGVAITIVGIALLSLQESLGFHPGDILCLGGAFMYSLQILFTDRFTREDDPLLIGIWQLAFAALYATICTIIFETPTLPSSGAEWGAVLELAIICSAFCFVLQPVAQAHTTPEHTALLFSLEPVSSAAFAFVFLHEVLNLQGTLGAILVLCGVIFASVGKEKKENE